MRAVTVTVLVFRAGVCNRASLLLGGEVEVQNSGSNNEKFCQSLLPFPYPTNFFILRWFLQSFKWYKIICKFCSTIVNADVLDDPHGWNVLNKAQKNDIKYLQIHSHFELKCENVLCGWFNNVMFDDHWTCLKMKQRLAYVAWKWGGLHIPFLDCRDCILMLFSNGII